MALELASGEPGDARIVSLALRNRSRAAHGWNNDAVQVDHNITTEPPMGQLDLSKLSREQRQALKEILLAARASRSED